MRTDGDGSHSARAPRVSRRDRLLPDPTTDKINYAGSVSGHAPSKRLTGDLEGRPGGAPTTSKALRTLV